MANAPKDSQMRKTLVAREALVLLVIVCTGIASGAQLSQSASKTGSQSVDIILEKLQQSTADLTSYQSQVQWIERQPSLDDSRTLKTGKFYLPARIIAVCVGPDSVEEDERDSFEIKFLKPKVNRKLSKKTFKITAPKRFGEPEIHPLGE